MVSRRTFVLRLLSLCGLSQATLTSCRTTTDAPPPLRRVRLGSLGEFTAPTRILFLERVLVRRDERGLSAMSMTCTHQSCMVQRQEGTGGGTHLTGNVLSGDSSKETNEFVCPCHGSRFDPSGKVLKGPAQRDLAWLPLELDSSKHIWATFGASVTSDWRLPVPEPA